jgi:hypothetical protein
LKVQDEWIFNRVENYICAVKSKWLKLQMLKLFGIKKDTTNL